MTDVIVRCVPQNLLVVAAMFARGVKSDSRMDDVESVLMMCIRSHCT